MAIGTASRPSAAPRSLAWPLTGRRGELDEVVESVHSDTVKAVLVTGEPGVGKTRLAREALDLLAAEGWSTVRVSGTSSTRESPLGAVAHLVPRHVLADPAALVAYVRAELNRRPRLVLGLDDAHLLDLTTVSLLGPLTDAAPARLVVTVPDVGVAPEPLAALWRQGRAHVVELGKLDDLAVDTLLHRVLGGPVTGATTLALIDASDGNPLFLREMVLGSLTAGTLREVDGVWRLDGAPQASGVLKSLVRARVESMGPAVRAVLEDLSLEATTGLPDLMADHDHDVVELAERSGLLRVAESGRRRSAMLAHGLHREVLRAGLGTVGAARLARRHAERIEERGLRRVDDHYRVALLRLDSDGHAPAEVMDVALELARAGRDLDSLERLTRAGLMAGGNPTAARMLAEVLYERGRFDEADQVLEDAVGRLAAGTDRDTLATLLTVRATVLAYGLGKFDDAIELLSGPELAEDLLSPAAATTARIRRAQFQLWRTGPAPSLAVLAEAAPDVPDDLRPAALAARVTALALGGRPAEAARLWVAPVPERPGTGEAAYALALTERGDLAAAEALAQQCYALTARARLPLVQLWFAFALGRSNLARGRPKLALWWYREQLGLARDLNQRLPLALAASGMMTAAALVGDDEAFGDAAAAWDGIGADPHAPSMFPGDLARGPAWRAMRAGDPEAAHALLAGVTARARDGGHVAQAAAAAYERVRLGRARAVADELTALAASDDGEVVRALAEHAAAVAGRDVDRLAGAADRAAGLGMMLTAAEAATEAADLARHSGDPRRAAALARHAAGWAGETEGARTPALVAADPVQVERLTAREREIAVLVAQGRTSKDIAAALVLSVRTVDNHLQRIFAKLGVSSRAEVTAALGEEGDG